MTKDEINIAIAEACGACTHDWSSPIGECQIGFIPQCNRCCVNADESAAKYPCALVDVPNYAEDLNVAIGLTGQLTSDGWTCHAANGLDKTWECIFTKRYNSDGYPRLGDHYGAAESLALAICEAFLRTIGKWKGAQ